jgi:outer membrane immunogenic protein
MMKTILLAGVAALALTATSAFAADLPNRKMAPVAPVMAAPVYNWTGAYAGVNAGYGMGQFNKAGGNRFKDSDGFVGGVQGGYNYQLPNNIVLGAEADVDFADLKGKASSTGVSGAKSKVDVFGTARVRAGYAFDRVLPYLTAGYAGINQKFNVPGSSNSSGLRNGYALGGGVEYALTNNITAKVEGLYSSFETKNVTGAGKVGTDITTVRGGVNYKF